MSDDKTDDDDDIITQNAEVIEAEEAEMTSTNHATGQDIELFDELFEKHPSSRLLVPTCYTRQQTARKVIRAGNRTHNIGYFASRLNQAMVPFESTLEKQACALFEATPKILGYISQPFAITVSFDGRTRTVFPDFELVMQDKRVLVDVKPHNKTLRRSFVAREQALTLYAALRGMHYTVMTEKHIRVPRMWESLWLYNHVRRGRAVDVLIETVWDWLHEIGQVTYGDAFDLSESYPAVQTVIASLILDGRVAVDWAYPVRVQPVCLAFYED